MPTYPLTSKHFQVEWGGTKIGFMEVHGLSMSTGVIKTRDGASPEFSVRKMPGMMKYENIIFKRAIREGDNEFFDWFNTISLNQVERRDITISLLNESHEPIFIWKIRNAFPVRIEYSPLNAMANEPAMEMIEIAHEGMRVEAI